MIASRRTRWNFGLQHAVARAQRLGRPLVILEALRCDYPWASDRIHAFILQGMADNARSLEGRSVTYHPWVEREPGEGKGLLAALATEACLVVTDDFPGFFLRRMVEAAGRQLDVPLEAVDSNGLLPLRSSPRAYNRAFDFRRFVQRDLLPHLDVFPLEDPLAGVALPDLEEPPAAFARWPVADAGLLETRPEALASLPIDHDVPVVNDRGGTEAAGERLRRFAEASLSRYADLRRHPDDEGASGLSPWLHFGHVSAHEIFRAVLAPHRWTPAHVGAGASGAREGWWGLPPDAEAFLDQLVTWRELGFHFAHHRGEDMERYEGLPEWARLSLEEHVADPRPVIHTRETLERAESDDELWNAAQRQLRGEGRIHNVVRMNWGKSVLQWTKQPSEAWEHLVHLNNRWALDGRDPNSYSGIGWCLGRFDRAWGPERPVFGKVRYMTTASTRRKVRLRGWLERWG
jgi:deoxyribodipyrimidine photo-lyase